MSRFAVVGGSDATVPQVSAGRGAARLLEELCRAQGPQVLVLPGACSAPSVAAVHRRSAFRPRDTDRLVGQVVGCAVYAPAWDIEHCPHTGLVIDARRIAAEEPVLVVRRESTAEFEKRVWCPNRHADVRQSEDLSRPGRGR
jgi:uncharacterized protein (DUF779 family)